jgi:hypothetical protein
MPSRKKKLERWKYNTPTDAPLDNVLPVINYYFGKYEQKGSHIVIKDDRLVECGFTEIAGILTIPVKGGQKVRGQYLQDLVLAIEAVTREEI